MRLGTCVTNPATREPSVTASALATLDQISGGRMDLGIGRGDSAVRVLGKPPTTMKSLEQAVTVIRDLVEGRTTDLRGSRPGIALDRTAGSCPYGSPGYGPMALALTGRIADGLILQLADPDLIRWMAGLMHEAAEKAGRDPAAIRVQAAAPAHVGPIEECREHVRWFPALVSNHVVDLVNKYPSDQLPESLTGYLHDRGRQHRPSSRRGRVCERGVRHRRCRGSLRCRRPARQHMFGGSGAERGRCRPVQPLSHERDEESQLEAYGPPSSLR